MTLVSDSFDSPSIPSEWFIGSGNSPVANHYYWGPVDASYGGEGTHSGSGKLHTFAYPGPIDRATPWADSAVDTVLSRTLDLTGMASATLSYWYKIPESPLVWHNYAHLDFSVSFDGVPLAEVTAAVENWTQATIDLTPLCGRSGRLTFRYEGSGGEGAYLDDLLVTAVQDELDLSVSAPGKTPALSYGRAGEVAAPEIVFDLATSSGKTSGTQVAGVYLQNDGAGTGNGIKLGEVPFSYATPIGNSGEKTRIALDALAVSGIKLPSQLAPGDYLLRVHVGVAGEADDENNWEVLRIVVVPPPALSAVPAMRFGDGFEGDLAGWQIGSGTQWMAMPSGFGGEAAHLGDVMVYAAGTQYQSSPGEANPTITGPIRATLSRVLDLGDAGSAQLHFWYKVPSKAEGDRLVVGIGSADAEDAVWTEVAETWRHGVVDLSQHVGRSPRVYFTYWGTAGEGAYLDDIFVTTTPREANPPVGMVVEQPGDITQPWTGPVYVTIDYTDDSAVWRQTLEASRLNLLRDGVAQPTGGAVESVETRPGGVARVRYRFDSPWGTWDVRQRGTYTLAVAEPVRDLSGNAAVITGFDAFEVTTLAPLDFAFGGMRGDRLERVFLPRGAALPGFTPAVQRIQSALPYQVEVYLVESGNATAEAPKRQIGSFTYHFGSTEVSGLVDMPLAAQLGAITVPADVAPGTYALGFHVVAPSETADPNDGNNWGVLSYLTVQPTLSGSPVFVDVTALYTPAARDGVGGEGAIRQKIADGAAYMNRALLNSNVNVQVRIVHVEEVAYDESGTINTDLTRLRTPGDGFLDGVQALRDRYLADAVTLWTGSAEATLVGLSYITGKAEQSGDAYSVIVAPRAEDWALAHELGHTLGAGHVTGDSVGSLEVNSDDGAFAYSHGFRFQPPGSSQQFRDIMAYAPGTMVPYYSSPDVNYLGAATGSASADNARTIRETAATVTKYRSPTVSVAALTAQVPEAGGVAAFRVTADVPAVLADPISFVVHLSVGGTATPGTDFSGGTDAVTITIPAGARSAFVDLALSAMGDAAAETQEMISLTLLPGSDYRTDVTSATITIADDDVQAIVVSSASLGIHEGSTATFTVRLAAQPPTPVQVRVPGVPGARWLATPDVLTFDSGNWSADQTVTVSWPDDGNAVSETTTVALTADGIPPATVTLHETDAQMPRIASLAISPGVVSRKGKFTAVATAAPGAGRPSRVEFYRDVDGDGLWTPADIAGKLFADTSAKGGWVYKGVGKGLPVGPLTLFAVAVDAAGSAGGAAKAALDVQNTPPTLNTFSAKVVRGQVLVAAAAKDADGAPPTITAWLDRNANGLLDDGEDVLTGHGKLKGVFRSLPSAPFSVIAYARDPEGAQTAVRSIPITPKV